MTSYVRPSKSRVNLGNLYRSTFSSQYPCGYGYFHNGSMFITTGEPTRHDIFEKRMKYAAQLFSVPMPHIEAMEDRRTHGKRVIMIQ
jgi:hypothetical protein